MNEDDDNVPLGPRELLEEIILAIVINDPDQVKVEELRSNEKTIVYNVAVSDRDRGLIIGSKGYTAANIKAIMTLVGQRLKKYIEVRIDGGTNFQPKQKPHYNQQNDGGYQQNQHHQHHQHQHHQNRNQFGNVPAGYVMVPASSVIQVPDNYGKRRTYNNNRHHNRSQEQED